VGDPINAVRIFNEKEVDELMVIDIDATTKGLEPDYIMIEHLARECRMPLCYGGGIKTPEQAQRIFCLGVEKVAISSMAITNPLVVSEIAKIVGNQSVIIVIDIKRNLYTGNYKICTHNGQKPTNLDLLEFTKKMENLGAGELIINSIDRDGLMNGFDITLIKKIHDVISIPITALGGAGSLEDIGILIKHQGLIGAAAGSLFVFKGKYKAVLINYPNVREKRTLLEKYFLNERKEKQNEMQKIF